MIPSFEDNGYLPPGLHPATLDEIAERFGTEPELRRVQMESLRWLVDLAWRAGAMRIVINGSFATDAWEPNDVDCVLLIGTGFPRDAEAEEALLAGLPFLQVELAEASVFDEYVNVVFGTDRSLTPKGMIEVIP
jgi:hypothetical protein